MPSHPHYQNPILDADWPDLDAIRVGERYYMVCSSSNRSPGLPVLASDDLVSWTVVARALPRLVPEARYATPRHGSGVWAPALRHRDGRFWIFYPDPDQGIFVISAEDVEGPWSAPTLIYPVVGAIDPCPFWDDDGRLWMIFGWARSRAGIANRLDIVELSADASRVIGEPFIAVDGDALAGYHTLEGPKLYRRGDTYWIFAPAGGVTHGWQSAFRSHSLQGPWEERILLEQGDTDVNGPHQGAWVEAVDGSDWFLHFQDRGVHGRVVHLQPMKWGSDGWPVLGEEGRPMRSARSPHRGQGVQVSSVISDDFTTTRLAAQWYWQANVGDDVVALPGDGTIRFIGTASDEGDLRKVPQILAQPLPSRAFRMTTHVTVAAGSTGRAGAVILGAEYLWVGCVAGDGRTILTIGKSTPTGERTLDTEEVASATRVRIDVVGTPHGVITVSASTEDGTTVSVAGWQAKAGHWVGAELGVFAAAPVEVSTPIAASFEAVKMS